MFKSIEINSTNDQVIVKGVIELKIKKEDNAPYMLVVFRSNGLASTFKAFIGASINAAYTRENPNCEIIDTQEKSGILIKGNIAFVLDKMCETHYLEKCLIDGLNDRIKEIINQSKNYTLTYDLDSFEIESPSSLRR